MKVRNKKDMTPKIDISKLFNPKTKESWLYKEYKKYNKR